MKIKYRVFISLFILVFIIFLLFVYFIRNDLGKRYMESVEDTLADTANVLASYVESEAHSGKIDPSNIKLIIDRALKRKLNAKIYDIKKTNIGINIYIVDSEGIILYDSGDDGNTGKDFSKWNDVYLTLKGQYGARLSKSIYRSTGAIYVAAPVLFEGKIIGALTVVKSKENVDTLIRISRDRVILLFIIAFLLYFIISFFLIGWINEPLKKLTLYVNSIKTGEMKKLPVLRSVEIRELGLAFENILSELESKQYIEKYIQTLTHEIKSPLSSIRGAAELLDEDMDDGQREKFYRNITEESRRIEDIVTRMLELSAIENRKELKDVSWLNMRKLTDEVIESFTPQIRKKRIHIENNVSDDVFVSGENFLIRHCISNIFENALRFSYDNGRIVIGSERSKSHVRLSVKDSGAGIPEYAVNKIFDRFYSVPPKNMNKSTGLGLSFVKEIMILHRGSVAIYNNPDKGVTAVLIFPSTL